MKAIQLPGGGAYPPKNIGLTVLLAREGYRTSDLEGAGYARLRRPVYIEKVPVIVWVKFDSFSSRTIRLPTRRDLDVTPLMFYRVRSAINNKAHTLLNKEHRDCLKALDTKIPSIKRVEIFSYCFVHTVDTNQFVDSNTVYQARRAGGYYSTPEAAQEADQSYMEQIEKDRIRQERVQRRLLHSYHSGPSSDLILDADKSAWRVGFEIEKTQLPERTEERIEGHGTEALFPECPLIAKYEEDSSCGYEMITHVVPLEPDNTKVLKAINQANEVINLPWNSNCGGHINISHKYMDRYTLGKLFADHAGLLYSVYRHRLRSNYIRSEDYPEVLSLGYLKDGEDQPCRYLPFRRRPFGIEIRLPSAVRNTEQLKRRYTWIAHYMRNIAAGYTPREFVEAMREPTITLYNRATPELAEKRLLDALEFQRMVNQSHHYKIFEHSEAQRSTEVQEEEGEAA